MEIIHRNKSANC